VHSKLLHRVLIRVLIKVLPPLVGFDAGAGLFMFEESLAE
jgi:hypothetical protein